MDRRSFFHLAAIGAVGCASATIMGGCTPTSEQPLTSSHPTLAEGGDISFSRYHNVLIIGSGIAGLSAAMAPSKAGLSVLVADKDSLLGGESFAAVGIMRTYGTQLQQKAGLSDTVEQAWSVREKDLRDAGLNDERLAIIGNVFRRRTTWVDEVIDSYGAQFADPASYTEKGTDPSILIPRTGLSEMESIMTPFRDKLSEQGVEFQMGTEATQFILDEKGTVAGARFFSSSTNSTIDVKADVVVIATGGYAASQMLIHDHQPAYETTGCITHLAMGEGHAMATMVGGALVDMDATENVVGDLPQVCSWGLFGPVIAVNHLGARFAREDDMFSCANACWKKQDGFWWAVFDSKLATGVQANSLARTVVANADHVAGPFDTVEALASKMGMGSTLLKNTINNYNDQATANEPDSFGKTHFISSLTPPYYAAKLRPLRYRTTGGIRVNANMQMLDGRTKPVENVYACGAAAGVRSEGLLDCASSGLIAGEAIAEKLQDR